MNLSSTLHTRLTRVPLLHSQIRTKTFTKKISKAQKRILAHPIAPITKNYEPVLENKFWKVVAGMKVYKNVTNGSRHKKLPTRFHLYKYSAVKRLSFGYRSTGGRNNSGQVTVRGRGGGHKKRIRIVDFKRTTTGPHQVVRLEYDPNRSANLALMRNLNTNEFSYIIHPKDVKIGDTLYSWNTGIPPTLPGETPLAKSQMIQPGNVLCLRDIPVGTVIHNISLKAGCRGQLCRSAGTCGQVLSTGQTGFAQVRLNSKEVRLIHVDCSATIGMVGNLDHHNTVLGKAGASRRMGLRPKVRGIAMSPYDHPHGGGRKSKGNKHPRSPWGWKTKGWKTVRRKKWFVVSPKWKAK